MTAPVRDERGFTLIELLAAILIIGILAAIAVPALLGQRARASDAEAKQAARTAHTAITAWNVEHGDYNATADDLSAIEPSLTRANNFTVVPGADTFTVSVEAREPTGGGVFSIEGRADGTVVRDCSAPGRATCPATADAQGNRW